MNFMGKVNNTSLGYYQEYHQNNNSSTPSMVIPSSSSTTLVSSPNFNENQYFYAGASFRSAAPELDLMDVSTLHPPSDQNRNNNNDSDNYSQTSTVAVVEREHMFDKVVTPSDVGKLNRLVIPKQHAEKYFPLDFTSNDNKRGLMLNFEDYNRKIWRFRYSYWNSSQSYVMTKGWSRFVKDKELNAGDVVSFHRGLGHQDMDRLFILWKRRPPPPPPDHMPFSTHHNFSLLHTPQYPHQHYFPSGSSRSSPVGWSSVPSGRVFYLPDHALRPGDNYYPNTGYNNVVYGYGGTNNASTSTSHDDLLNNNNPSGNSVIYFRLAGAGANTVAPQYRYQQQVSLESEMMMFSSGSSGEFRGGREHVFESVPVVQGKAAAKRLRLFGVNMDCPISHKNDDEDEDHDVTILPSTTTTMVLLPH